MRSELHRPSRDPQQAVRDQGHTKHTGGKFIYFNIQTVLIEEVVAMVSRRINRLIDFYSMLRASGGGGCSF